MSVTQKQIAERLNISPSLVGRALAGHPEVAEKTKQRVEAVAKEMGYSLNANSAARALAAKRYGLKIKKGIIAVAFPPIELASPRHTPFFAPIIEGMETEAARQGIELYSCVLRHNELPVLVREQEVDGIILLGSSETGAAVVGQVEKLGLPALTVHWRCSGARSVAPDDRDGARQATRHLLELGHRRIGFLGVQGFKTYTGTGPESAPIGDIVSLASIQRLQGYLDAMGEYGVEVREEWIEDSLPLRTLPGAYCPGCGNCASCSGWSVLKAQNPEGEAANFTALVCHNDSVAMGAVIKAQQEGFDVPGDLSVVGFDNLSHEFNFQPELTSVSFPRYEMGRQAIQLLNQAGAVPAGDEGRETPAWHHVFPAELMIGASTGSPVSSSDELAEAAR